MKKTIIAAAFAAALAVPAFAQSRSAQPEIKLNFTTVKENPITSIKNQASSGTCWSYSTIAFVESEIIRNNNIKDPAKYPDLSEFFVVSHSYSERADKYLRVDGALGFSVGSSAEDVMHVIRDHGMVTNEAMTGMNYGSPLPQQSELDNVLLAYMNSILTSRKLTTAWKRGFDAILAEYLGEYPETFVVDGKQYTPESYRDALKFNPDDYISLTSFSHHPFYSWFPLEVHDNWRWDSMYNVPIDDLMQIIDNAINGGSTIAWGADVSSPGFNRNGYGLFLDTVAQQGAGSDQAHWVGSDPNGQKVEYVEKTASQDQRQYDFDNKILTDDHGMQIYGIAKDETGNKFYMVKNSWGESGDFKGIWYCSEAFVKGSTMDILVHKDFLTKEVKKKLGIK